MPVCPGSYDKGTWNNCLGTYTWSPENKYVGAWKDGKKHGQGTHTFPDGSMYVGTWKDGNKHGKGTNTFPDGSMFVGTWEDGNKPVSYTHLRAHET